MTDTTLTTTEVNSMRRDTEGRECAAYPNKTDSECIAEGKMQFAGFGGLVGDVRTSCKNPDVTLTVDCARGVVMQYDGL